MWDRIHWVGMPVLMTLLLHAVVVVTLLWRWPDPRTVEASAPPAAPIQAMLVSAEQLRPKPAPVPPRPVAPRPRTPPKPEANTQQRPEPRVQPTVVAPERVDLIEAEDPPTPELSEAELAALTRAEIEAALALDMQSDNGASATLRDRVSATIRLAVVNRWTRPPSARNGMLAVLAIQLVPTGDVVSVSVEQSSGDNAFDRSAINAVEKAARFPEVAQLDTRTFERDVRRFTLIFRPEDLRY